MFINKPILLVTKSIFISLLILILTSCGGGGSGSSASSDGDTQVNTSAESLPPIVSVQSISTHHVRVTFTEPADPDVAANTENYIIKLPNGNDATVVAADPSDDGMSVLLTLAPMDESDEEAIPGGVLTFELLDIPDSDIIFVGSETPEPVLLSAGALSSTQVLLKFSESMSSTAEDHTNYQILKESDGKDLVIKGAVRTDSDTGVILSTGPQDDGVYRVIASNLITRVEGIPIDPMQNERTFLGMSEVTGISSPPRVAGAISQSNTTVVVTFNKPMGESAENSANYAITQDNVNPEAGALSVISARFIGSDQTAVELLTSSQNEVSYTVTVVNVRDTFGQQLEVVSGSTGVFLTNQAGFAGTPPGGDEFVDSDGDGLFDNEEQRGWRVSIELMDGTIYSREVTSSPLLADTDNDGLTDKQELALHSDPRDRDTDDDELPDAYEFNAVFTEPLQQDTDKDGLSDGLEVGFFRTSPLLDDTDGDQIPDSEEIILANRNALIADLPQPAFEIESLSLNLDVRFEQSKEGTVVNSEEKAVSTTLTQSQTKSFSQTDETNNKVSGEVTASTEWEWSAEALGLASAKVGLEVKAGYEHGWSSSWTQESSKSTQNEYNKTLSTGLETSEGTTLSRRVESADISTLVYLKAKGSIAFTISDIQITALVPDVKNPGKYLPLATLVPENPNDDAQLQNSYNLGPLVDQIGPLRFISRDVFPVQVERLMRDPTGVIFKISNYNITDEVGRNFAYTSQEIIDRTTAFTIDFGGRDNDGDGIADDETTERYRVATSFGRTIGSIVDAVALDEGLTQEDVRKLYGLAPDDEDSPIVFYLSGKNTGVVFHDVMQNVLDLERYDAAVDTTDEIVKFGSYATEFDSNGVERIVRVKQYSNDSTHVWSLLTPSGLILGGQLSLGNGGIEQDDQVIFPGSSLNLAYVQDNDSDHIPARLEYMHGCDDEKVDSDNDGMTDYFEVFGAPKYPGGAYVNPDEVWWVEIEGLGRYEGFSSCISDDTDQDGIPDSDEYALGLDAKKQDTDGDNISDYDELNGFDVYLEFPLVTESTPEKPASTCEDVPDDPIYYPGLDKVFCYTYPLDPDTDNDGLPDGDEQAFLGDPTYKDAGDVFDLDGDGLLGREENDGWIVRVYMDNDRLTYKWCLPDPNDADTQCELLYGDPTLLPTSNVTLPDTDYDGVVDSLERDEATHPRVDDTDQDGRTDHEEIFGYSAIDGDPNNLVFTDPIVKDTDTDGRTDGEEVNTPWIVEVIGQEPKEVYSDPNDDDKDNDQLLDGGEEVAGTDPGDPNTDDDELQLDDKTEIALGLDPLNPNDICVRARYNSVFVAHNFYPDTYDMRIRGAIKIRIRESGADGPILIDPDFDVTADDKETVSLVGSQYTTYVLLNESKAAKFYNQGTEILPNNASVWTWMTNGSYTLNRDQLSVNDKDINMSYRIKNTAGARVEVDFNLNAKVMEKSDVVADPTGTFCQGQ